MAGRTNETVASARYVDLLVRHAASGHAAAVLPRNVMNSRRLMGAYPKAKITDQV
jgi:hypothetical protein